MLHPDLAFIVDGLRARKLRIGFAESCTGGRLSADLTTVPGSSLVVAGSLVCYQVEVKQRILDMYWVTEENVVSEKVARKMAESATDLLEVDIGVATTGYLDGDHPEVYWAIYAPALKNREIRGTQHMVFPKTSSRTVNREHVIHAVMGMLTTLVKDLDNTLIKHKRCDQEVLSEGETN